MADTRMFRAKIAVHIKAENQWKAEGLLGDLFTKHEADFAEHGISLIWVDNLPKALATPYRAPKSMGATLRTKAEMIEEQEG